MDNLLAFLSAIHPLPTALTEHLSSVLQHRVVPRKDFLLKRGQVNSNIYFIDKGLLRCFYMKGDTEVSSWFMKECDVVISIDSFYEQQPSYEYIQALEDTELYYISHAELERIYAAFPSFNIIGRILTQHYHKHWAHQLYYIRMQDAKERYQWLLKEHVELVRRVPAKFLASYLGITEITLSKIKGSLARNRVNGEKRIVKSGE